MFAMTRVLITVPDGFIMLKTFRIAVPFAALALIASAGLNTAQAAEQLNDTDRTFLIDTAHGLKFGAAAAKLADTRADLDKLKSYAKRDLSLIERMTPALEELAQKKSVKLPTAPTAEQTERINALRKLRDKPFDRKYIEALGSPYQFQVHEAFKRTAERSVDLDVRNFARKWLPEVHQNFTSVNSVTSDVSPDLLRPSENTAPRRGEPPRDGDDATAHDKNTR